MDRNKDIDNLRGLAMIAMMMIHACSYFIKTKGVFLLWNYLQWAVPVFLFCSFYITFANKKKIDVIKRLKRLYIPYFSFLIIYFFLVYFFQPSKLNIKNILANVFMYGGLDYNWLVLLFFYFTILIPVIKVLEKKKIIFYLIFLISVLSSIFFVFSSPFNYRAIMWLPWMTYIFFTYFFVKNESNKKIIIFTAIISFIVFLIINFIEIMIGKNTSQFANKYPPTILHLSFGIFSTIVLYQISKLGFFDNKLLKKILSFFSVNSYSLYFIHIIVILIFGWTGLIWRFNWFSFFLLIVLLSSGGLNLFRSFYKSNI